MMKALSYCLLLFSLTLWGERTASAQEDETSPLPSAIAYVTTQDYVSLRQGPSTRFDRITVVPAAITLPAYGRTSDTGWIQVLYEGQYGWMSALYLVWSGEVIDLPVDGVNPHPFIRRAAALGVTTRETPIYQRWIVPGEEVGYIPTGTLVELTGRMGGSGFFRFQVRWENELYWVGNWNIRIHDGDYMRLLDLTGLYSYGRLIKQLEQDYLTSAESFITINTYWGNLAEGKTVTCHPVNPIQRRLSREDVAFYALFEPPVMALDTATTLINGAISAFDEACNAPNFTLTEDYIHTQQENLNEAQRNLIIVRGLVQPLAMRDPQLEAPPENTYWLGGY